MIPNKPDVVLKQINFRILSDRDRLDILQHIVDTLAKIAGTDPHLDKLRGVLSDILDGLYAATHKVHGHSATVLINNLYEECKKIIAKMHDGISFFKGDDDADVTAAADLVENLFNRHLAKPADNKQRTLIAAVQEFLKEAEEPAAAAAVEKIQLLPRVEKLETAQRRMVQLTLQRAEDEELDSTPNLVPMRDAMVQFVTALEKALYVEVSLNEPGMSELVHKLNGRIGEIMTTAKALHTMEENGHLKEKDKSDNSGETEETPEEIDEIPIPEETTPDEESEQEGTGEEESEEKAFTRDDR